MVEPAGPNDAASKKKEPFQFSLRSMLLLTVLCSIAAALTGSLDAPTPFRLVIALYLMLMVTYIVLRLPYTCRGLARVSARWSELRQKRKELESMMAERRRHMKK